MYTRYSDRERRGMLETGAARLTIRHRISNRSDSSLPEREKEGISLALGEKES